MQLVEIAECMQLAPVLARWHVAEWGHLYPDWTIATADTEFQEMSVPGRIPTTWVALRNGVAPGSSSEHDVLGSVSLIANDELAGFDDLHPWLASLLVVPTARGLGLGTQLVQRVIAHCHAAGIDRVHLFTAGQYDYYVARGWHAIAPATANGVAVTVMTYETDPRAPRRSVVSGWIADPNTLGAYSYLRPGGTPQDRRRLAAPITAGMWFAGEATSHEYPGTMHGAWFSGEHAAAQLHATTLTAAPVVVVGAGLAGLAAARQLGALGHPVTVLESTQRPGGRTRADTSLGATVHLGAAWLHGDIANPLKEQGGVEARAWDWGAATTFLAGRSVLSAADERRLEGVLADIETALDAVEYPGEHIALGPLLARLLQEHAPLAEDRTVLGCWLRGTYEKLYAASLDDLSLQHRAEPYRLPGPDMMITSSLDVLTARMAADVDIRYNSPVATIVRTNGGFRLSTAANETIEAEAVVVTVPIGVLKSGRIQFDPPLPHDVSNAMFNIGSGHVAKAFFTFDEAWWAPIGSFMVAADPPVPLEVWVDVTLLAGRPTLCAFATGEHAVWLEHASEDDRLRLAMSVLRFACF